jgi:hypothetical protein
MALNVVTTPTTEQGIYVKRLRQTVLPAAQRRCTLHSAMPLYGFNSALAKQFIVGLRIRVSSGDIRQGKESVL